MRNFFNLKKIILDYKALNLREKIYIVLIVSSILLSLLYQFLNKAPQKWDSAAHINLAMLYANKLKELNFTEIATLSGYYPPFVHLLGAVFFIIFGFFNSPLLLSFIFLLIGIVFIVKLVHSLTQSREQGLFAGLILALIPQVYIESRLFQLDLPLTVLLTICLFYLFKSRSFTSKKSTLLFFVATAFAQLTKWYAFVYLLVPFSYILATLIKNEQREKALKNLLMGLLVALSIALPWYVINSSSILAFFTNVSAVGEKNDPESILSIESILEYFRLTFSFQLSFPLFIIMMFSTVYLWLKQKKAAALLTVSMVVPWIVFTLLKNKDARYIMPLIPYYVVSLSLTLHKLSATKTKFTSFIKIIVTTYLCLLFLFISFNQISSIKGPAQLIGQIYAGPENKYNWFNQSTNEYAYSTSNWQLASMFNHIVKELDQYNEKSGKIMFAVDYPYFNTISFDSLQIYNNTRYKVSAGYEIRELNLNSFEDIKKTLSTSVYVVTAYSPGFTNLNHYDNMVKINRFMQQQGNEFFESKASYKLPNGEEVYLFRNKQQSIFKSF